MVDDDGIERCDRTGLTVPECSCKDCLDRQFSLYLAEHDAERLKRGEPSPEQVGRRQAHEQLAREAS